MPSMVCAASTISRRISASRATCLTARLKKLEGGGDLPQDRLSPASAAPRISPHREGRCAVHGDRGAEAMGVTASARPRAAASRWNWWIAPTTRPLDPVADRRRKRPPPRNSPTCAPSQDPAPTPTRAPSSSAWRSIDRRSNKVRRLDRSAQRGVERPSLHQKPVNLSTRRSLRYASLRSGFGRDDGNLVFPVGLEPLAVERAHGARRCILVRFFFGARAAEAAAVRVRFCLAFALRLVLAGTSQVDDVGPWISLMPCLQSMR
jgi:hypothetical protein